MTKLRNKGYEAIMALSNAERQARWRERRNALARAAARKIAKLEARIAELEAALKQAKGRKRKAMAGSKE